MDKFVHNFLKWELLNRAFSLILMRNCSLNGNAKNKNKIKKSLLADQGKQYGSLPSIQGLGRRKGKGEDPRN